MEKDRNAEIAREFLAMHKVYRYRLKKIVDMDDGEVKGVCHWWYTENGLEREYRLYENQKLGIEPSNVAAPKHPSDLEAVRALVKEPSEKLRPILPALMEWLKDMNWPVAQALLPLLVREQDETACIAEDILKPEQPDDVWKYWIVSAFAPGLSPKNQQKLKEKIRRIACQPTPGEHAEEVDEVAKAYLSEHA